ncbi:hypothetical protein ACIBHY_16455 [Nonomuraea sp. NPDC050547]|uniref:hypothetical protein n=1 Tax=Nonomuraea sp. NPDC050547 TaxID=3364368 RepID=UPI0037939B54
MSPGTAERGTRMAVTVFLPGCAWRPVRSHLGTFVRPPHGSFATRMSFSHTSR